jgi:hypothetical protein
MAVKVFLRSRLRIITGRGFLDRRLWPATGEKNFLALLSKYSKMALQAYQSV